MTHDKSPKQQERKIYTDGTVRYGCFTSTREPQNLAEVVGDKK
jgi:hypothetical protein